MNRKIVAALVSSAVLSIGALGDLEGQGQAVFYLGPKTTGAAPAPGTAIRLPVGTCATTVTLYAYAPGGADLSTEGFTAVVETSSASLNISAIVLGRGVDADLVNLFSPSNEPGANSTVAAASVIFETLKTLTIPRGVANAIALLDYSVTIDPADPSNGEFLISFTNAKSINGFLTRNMVTVGGLTQLADITRNPSVDVDAATLRIELMGCSVSQNVWRLDGADAFQVELDVNVFNYDPATYDREFTILIDEGSCDRTITTRFPNSRGTPDLERTITVDFSVEEALSITPGNPCAPPNREGQHKFKIGGTARLCGQDVVVWSNVCVAQFNVLEVEESGMRNAAGPYWCTVHPHLEVPLLKGVLEGDLTVSDPDLLSPAQRTSFEQNGCKLAFYVGPDSTSGRRQRANYCVISDSLLGYDEGGVPFLSLPRGRQYRPGNPDNAQGLCSVPGYEVNVPRDVPVEVWLLADGDVVRRSVNAGTAGADAVYTFGYKRGDVNLDQVVDIRDPIDLLNGLFLPGSSPASLACHSSANANGGGNGAANDDFIDISDAIYLLRFLLIGGAAPPPLPPFARSPWSGFGIYASDIGRCVDPNPLAIPGTGNCVW